MLRELPPYSYASMQAYTDRLSAMKENQLNAHNERVRHNREYAMNRVAELVSEYKKSDLDRESKMTKAGLTNRMYVCGDPEYYVVILLRSKIRMSHKLKKVCELFRLEKINTLVLVRNNESNRRMLQLVRNYVAYGFIDVDMLRRLVYRRGIGRVDGKPVNITNEVLEDVFEGGIRCVEEIVYNIHYGTEHFKVINNFLMPFTLNSPRGGFRGKKNKDYVEGGCMGNWYHDIGRLLSRMID